MNNVSTPTFKFFCRKCRYWLKQFGITDYTVYFSLEEIKESAAEVRVDNEGRGLTFVLPDVLDDTSRKSVDHSAIHEVAHAAVAKLVTLAHDRYATEKDIDDAEEALVCRITTLISNLSKPSPSRG
jgi:hypothetical protein